MRAVLPILLAVSLAWPGPAAAQGISLDLGEGGSVTAASIQLIALITLLSIAPGIAIMVKR